MTLKRRFRIARRRLQFYLMLGVAKLARLVGFGRLRAIGQATGELEFRLARASRSRCLHDLAAVLGRSANDPEVHQTLRQAYRTSNGTVLEFLAMHDRPLAPEDVRRYCTVHQLRHLDHPLAAKQPVILLNNHMGNFVLMQAWLAGAGYPVSVVHRESNKIPAGFFDNGLAAYGITGIRANNGTSAYRSMLRALRNGQIISIMMDQGTKYPGGVPVRFLGKDMKMPVGPAQLARQAGAVVVPVTTLSAHPRWEFAMEPPVAMHPDGPIEADVRRLSAVMERQILARPHLWSWHQRRWRRHPLPTGPEGAIDAQE